MADSDVLTVELNETIKTVINSSLEKDAETDKSKYKTSGSGLYTLPDENLTYNIYDPIVWHDRQHVANDKREDTSFFVDVLPMNKPTTNLNTLGDIDIDANNQSDNNTSKTNIIVSLNHVTLDSPLSGDSTQSSNNNQPVLNYMYIEYTDFLPTITLYVDNYKTDNIADLYSTKIYVTMLNDSSIQSPYRTVKLPFKLIENEKPILGIDGTNTIKFKGILDIEALSNTKRQESILFYTCEDCRVKGLDPTNNKAMAKLHLTEEEQKTLDDANNNYADDTDKWSTYTRSQLLNRDDAHQLEELLKELKDLLELQYDVIVLYDDPEHGANNHYYNKAYNSLFSTTTIGDKTLSENDDPFELLYAEYRDKTLADDGVSYKNSNSKAQVLLQNFLLPYGEVANRLKTFVGLTENDFNQLIYILKCFKTPDYYEEPKDGSSMSNETYINWLVENKKDIMDMYDEFIETILQFIHKRFTIDTYTTKENKTFEENRTKVIEVTKWVKHEQVIKGKASGGGSSGSVTLPNLNPKEGDEIKSECMYKYGEKKTRKVKGKEETYYTWTKKGIEQYKKDYAAQESKAKSSGSSSSGNYKRQYKTAILGADRTWFYYYWKDAFGNERVEKIHKDDLWKHLAKISGGYGKGSPESMLGFAQQYLGKIAYNKYETSKTKKATADTQAKYEEEEKDWTQKQK